MDEAHWTVTRQPETIGTDPPHEGKMGRTVFFDVHSGGEGHVFVPYEHYTVAKVRELVSDEAAKIHAVNTMTSHPAHP